MATYPANSSGSLSIPGGTGLLPDRPGQLSLKAPETEWIYSGPTRYVGPGGGEQPSPGFYYCTFTVALSRG